MSLSRHIHITYTHRYTCKTFIAPIIGIMRPVVASPFDICVDLKLYSAIKGADDLVGNIFIRFRIRCKYINI